MRAEEWPFVGRLEESEFADRAVGRAGGCGVVVAGAAGVGKSRLWREVLERAQRRGAVIRSVVATRSARAIPFGALAGLLPPAAQPLAESPLGLMRALADALVAPGGQQGLVLGVDDAQLLDDGSAALIAQLVSGETCRLVLTVRSGEPVPDAIAALWKERLLEYLELQPLSAGETEQLLREALGGEVDGATLLRIFEVTRGNPLFVRELVTDGLANGQLTDALGVWRWTGQLRAGARLSELVASRLERLSTAERELLELVAIGEPLELGLLERLLALEPLVGLERGGLLEVVEDARRSHLRFVHPLYGEVLRGGAPALGTRVACGKLAGALAELGARRREDGLRAATWTLEAGIAGSPELLISGARQALAIFDTSLAERLARAAVDAGGGADATVLQGLALTYSGRFGEAEALLASAEDNAQTDAERAILAHSRVFNLIYGGGLGQDAAEVALQAESQIAQEDLRAELTALRTHVWTLSGRPSEALAVVATVPPTASERARIQAGISKIFALASLGRIEEANAVADEWYDAALRLDAELPFVSSTVQSTRVTALWLGGRLDEAQAIAEERYRIALERRGHSETTLWPMALGAIWLSRGRARTALRWLRESATLFRESDPIAHFRWCLGILAQALAIAGDAEGSQAAIDEGDALQTPAMLFMASRLDAGRGWAAAARGDRRSACAFARRLAEECEASGQLAYAVHALGELALFGEPEVAADGLEVLAGSVEGPLAPALANYARAAADRDGAALDRAGSELAAIGLDYVAAAAAHAAAGAHRGMGQLACARASAGRARALLERCEGARLPFAGASDTAGELTDRERQIASLAAQGLSNDVIASQLVLSVRTVENHLQRAYSKLGVSRRGQLAPLLTE